MLLNILFLILIIISCGNAGFRVMYSYMVGGLLKMFVMSVFPKLISCFTDKCLGIIYNRFFKVHYYTVLQVVSLPNNGIGIYLV